MKPFQVYKAYVGWSNKHEGTELYQWFPRENGRWLNGRVPGWGALFAWFLEDEGYPEGTQLLIVPMKSRYVDEKTLDELADIIEDALND